MVDVMELFEQLLNPHFIVMFDLTTRLQVESYVEFKWQPRSVLFPKHILITVSFLRYASFIFATLQ